MLVQCSMTSVILLNSKMIQLVGMGVFIIVSNEGLVVATCFQQHRYSDLLKLFECGGFPPEAMFTGGELN